MKTVTKILIVSVVIIALLFYAVYWAFFDIQRIKGQKYLTESTSSDGKYTVTAYLNNGGATTSFAVLGTLKNNKTGRTKNIYWQYRCEDADITWKSNKIVVINGIELDVTKDTYDYRRK